MNNIFQEYIWISKIYPCIILWLWLCFGKVSEQIWFYLHPFKLESGVWWICVSFCNLCRQLIRGWKYYFLSCNGEENTTTVQNNLLIAGAFWTVLLGTCSNENTFNLDLNRINRTLRFLRLCFSKWFCKHFWRWWLWWAGLCFVSSRGSARRWRVRSRIWGIPRRELRYSSLKSSE